MFQEEPVFRWQILVAATATVIGAASLGVAFRSDGSTDQEMELVASQVDPANATSFAFTVTATPVEDLYPGAQRRLLLTMKNPYTFDLQVTGVRAALVSTTNAGCEPVATNLEIMSYTGGLPATIPSGDSAETGAIPLHMPNTVANECQDAVFAIEVTADATRAER
jgi:hypothetical protein